MSPDTSLHVVRFIFMQFSICKWILLNVDGNLYRSIRLCRLSYVDKFIPKIGNLAELKDNIVVECIESENSPCILVNVDSYSYVSMDIC